MSTILYGAADLATVIGALDPYANRDDLLSQVDDVASIMHDYSLLNTAEFNLRYREQVEPVSIDEIKQEALKVIDNREVFRRACQDAWDFLNLAAYNAEGAHDDARIMSLFHRCLINIVRLFGV